MKLLNSSLLLLEWKALLNDWIRSSLTTFGVFMGVAAVSATLNIQSITSYHIEQKFLERDKPYVSPYIYLDEFDSPQINQDDALALRRAIPFIRSISNVGEVFVIQSVQYEDKIVENLSVSSVSLNYLDK